MRAVIDSCHAALDALELLDARSASAVARLTIHLARSWASEWLELAETDAERASVAAAAAAVATRAAALIPQTDTSLRNWAFGIARSLCEQSANYAILIKPEAAPADEASSH